MPIYEYYCSTCDIRFDKLLSMRQADHPAHCPQCHSLAGRCASTFAARGSGNSALAGSSSGCPSCTANSCAGCSNT